MITRSRHEFVLIILYCLTYIAQTLVFFPVQGYLWMIFKRHYHTRDNFQEEKWYSITLVVDQQVQLPPYTCCESFSDSLANNLHCGSWVSAGRGKACPPGFSDCRLPTTLDPTGLSKGFQTLSAGTCIKGCYSVPE